MDQNQQPLTEEELNAIYNWVDEIPLSRPKRNISRDFADGVLMAEMVAYCLPKYVELHNYQAASSSKQKKYNWDTLNKKVFKRLGFQLTNMQIDNAINAAPEAIELTIKIVKMHLDAYQNNQPIPAKNLSNSKSRTNEKGQQPQHFRNNQNSRKFKKRPDNQKQQADNVIWEKDQTIVELRETIEILELKIKKMEDLIRLKDNKIQSLTGKLADNGLL